MRKFLIAVFLTLSIMAMVGCGSSITHGRVIDKSYSPQETIMVPQYTTMCSGNPMVCRQQFIGFIPVTSGPSWSLDLKNDEEEGWVDVNQDTFNRVAVGDDYHVDY